MVITKIPSLLRLLEFFKKLLKSKLLLLRNADTVEELCAIHFSMWSDPNHINKDGLTLGLTKVTKDHPFIFETGTSAYGTDSTRLFDRFATKFSGEFHTVDINPRSSRSLKFQHGPRTNFHTSDSVDFIKNHLGNLTDRVDLCYLDSWDVDWLDPLPSAQHGLSEFLQVKKYLVKDSILIIDDTPVSLDHIPNEYHKRSIEFLQKHQVLPGKGSLALKLIKGDNLGEVLHHRYNVVIRIN